MSDCQAFNIGDTVTFNGSPCKVCGVRYRKEYEYNFYGWIDTWISQEAVLQQSEPKEPTTPVHCFKCKHYTPMANAVGVCGNVDAFEHSVLHNYSCVHGEAKEPPKKAISFTYKNVCQPIWLHGYPPGSVRAYRADTTSEVTDFTSDRSKRTTSKFALIVPVYIDDTIAGKSVLRKVDHLNIEVDPDCKVFDVTPLHDDDK